MENNFRLPLKTSFPIQSFIPSLIGMEWNGKGTAATHLKCITYRLVRSMSSSSCGCPCYNNLPGRRTGKSFYWKRELRVINGNIYIKSVAETRRGGSVSPQYNVCHKLQTILVIGGGGCCYKGTSCETEEEERKWYKSRLRQKLLRLKTTIQCMRLVIFKVWMFFTTFF